MTATRAPRLATEKQIWFVVILLDKHDHPLRDKYSRDELISNLRQLPTAVVSELIDVIKTYPIRDEFATAADRKAAATPAPTAGRLEAGIYEVDGTVYKVQWTQDRARQYAKKLVETGNERITEAGTVVEIEFEYAPGAIHHIRPEHRMPMERAEQLTIRYGRCLACGHALRAAKSVKAGIGPVCAKSFR